jgi:hypothetical protein
MVRLEAPDGRLADPGSQQVGFFFGQQQRAFARERLDGRRREEFRTKLHPA